MHRETIEARGSVRGGAAVSAGPGGLPPLPDLPDLDRYGGPFELITSDGEPLDSNWERLQIALMTHLVNVTMTARGRRRFFTGGDMFLYYDPNQARGIATNPGTREHYKGPDVFYVSDVEPGDREAWVCWIEGRYPEMIVEFVSPTSRQKDRVTNRDLYEQTFRTPEYFLYEPPKGKIEGLRLVGGVYQEIRPTADGRLWSDELAAYLGLWHGTYEKAEGTWVRLYDRQGRLLPTEAEEERRQKKEERRQKEEAERRAEEERWQKEEAERRAEEERRRAEKAEQERAEERRRAEEERRRVEEERRQKEEAERRAAEAEARLAVLEARFADPGHRS